MAVCGWAKWSAIASLATVSQLGIARATGNNLVASGKSKEEDMTRCIVVGFFSTPVVNGFELQGDENYKGKRRG